MRDIVPFLKFCHILLPQSIIIAMFQVVPINVLVELTDLKHECAAVQNSHCYNSILVLRYVQMYTNYKYYLY